MNYISPHISWEDAIRSDTAKREGINNWFTPEQLVRMTILANKVYEPLVQHFGTKIFISSFFRCARLNSLMGGAPASQHLANNGAAIDLDADLNPGVGNQEVFDYIKDNLEFDQLIAESLNPDGSIGWCHVSYNEFNNRHEVMKMVIRDGIKSYEPYTE
jgi:zinc D-Ala-D-Ala carboxypeptidase